MSNYGNRNSKMPDTSPTLRTDFSTKQAIFAFVLVLVVVAAGIACAYAFNKNHEQALEKAVSETRAEKSRFETAAQAVVAREAELDARELALNSREAELATTEASLTQRETDLAIARLQLENDKIDFAEHQNRVYTLAKALHEELSPDYADRTIYVDLTDPDLLIEEYEEPQE